MRALVTGAGGFIGANLVSRLAIDGATVCALVRPGGSTWRLNGMLGDVEVRAVDLAERAAVEDAFREARPERVFHTAVHGAYSDQTDARRMLAANVLGAVNVVEAGVGLGCEVIVNTGSSSEYGLKAQAPTEQEWLEPNSDYAVFKAAATLFCRSRASRQRTVIPTLRLYSVFGAFEEPRRLVPALRRHGMRGGLPPLVNPNVARDFVAVDDVVDAYLRAAEYRGPDPGAVFNIGSGVQTTIGQAVDIVRRVMQIDEAPRWGTMPDRGWDTTVWLADARRAHKELGWVPRHSFETGFRAFLEWVDRHDELTERYTRDD